MCLLAPFSKRYIHIKQEDLARRFFKVFSSYSASFTFIHILGKTQQGLLSYAYTYKGAWPLKMWHHFWMYKLYWSQMNSFNNVLKSWKQILNYIGLSHSFSAENLSIVENNI